MHGPGVQLIGKAHHYLQPQDAVMPIVAVVALEQARQGCNRM